MSSSSDSSSALCVALALGVAACGGSDDDSGGDGEHRQAGGRHAGRRRSDVKIAFSAPAPTTAGWPRSPTTRQAGRGARGRDVKLAEGATDSAAQADQIETLIAGKPDALVVLPERGRRRSPRWPRRRWRPASRSSTSTASSPSAGAYRTLIGGDNYGIGWQAGNYFADQLKCKGNVVEIQGIAGISVTEQRSQGFKDAIKRRCKGGIKIVASQPADFLPDKGLSVMENILQANKQIDAVYTHDDDMAEGVVSAIENAGREDEMFLTGAGGSKAAMEQIKEGGLYRATFLYNPSMSASAINLAA